MAIRIGTESVYKTPTWTLLILAVSLTLLSCSKSDNSALSQSEKNAGLAETSAKGAVPLSSPPEQVAVDHLGVLPEYMRALPFGVAAVYPGALAISANGRIAAHIALDGSVVIWDALTFEALETFVPESRRPSTLALSTNGDLIAVGYFDSVVAIRSLREHKIIRELQGHLGAISALAFSPDGLLLATGGDDATAQVWELTTGRRLHVFDSQFGGSARGGVVVGLGFSGDTRTLIVNEWYSRFYDVDRGATLWDLEDGVEIATRQVVPPNHDTVMRSGQAIGANNWLFAYTGQDGLVLERLDQCNSSRQLAAGGYADTLVADPQGRWVAALEDQALTFFGTSGDLAPISLKLPTRTIAMAAQSDGRTLFALTIARTELNGNEHFIVGRDSETVTAAKLHVIVVPEAMAQLLPPSIGPDAARCAPSDVARKQWAYRLPEKTQDLPIVTRVNPPGELVSREGNDPQADAKRFNPPTDLHFADDGMLYVLYHANTNAQSGVVVWDPSAKRVLRSHFVLYANESIVRLPQSWVTWREGLENLLKLDEQSDVPRNEIREVFYTSDRDTGNIYRLVPGEIEHYAADGQKKSPIAVRANSQVLTMTSRNNNVAVVYSDGGAEVWNISRSKMQKFKSIIDPELRNTCEVNEVPLLSADARFLQIPWSCVDIPTDYPIYDLRSAKVVAEGPVLGAFPRYAERGVTPDARPNQLGVWDFGKRELIARLPRQQSRDADGDYHPLLAAMSDDGRFVASASFEGLVRVWDIDTRRVIGEQEAGGTVTALAFDLTGQSLAVSRLSGEVLILYVGGTSGKKP